MSSHLTQYRFVNSKVEPYNPNYPQVFQAIKELLTQALPKVKIEHIGSTAIPAISGKRIIDILIPCSQLDFNHFLSQLEKAGFQRSPFDNLPADRPMKVAGITFQGEHYNIHVHLTQKNSETHLNNIYFRDQLIQNPQLAKEYERIKQENVASGKVEATEYNVAKAPFIQAVLGNRFKAQKPR